jgi:hypothetical protein
MAGRVDGKAHMNSIDQKALLISLVCAGLPTDTREGCEQMGRLMEAVDWHLSQPKLNAAAFRAEIEAIKKGKPIYDDA